LAIPDQVKTLVAFEVEGSTQIVEIDAVNGLVGAVLTVTITLVIGEVHAGDPALTTFNVIVLVPIEFQLIVCGP